MSKAVAITSEYRTLPLAQLQESPTNPRRRFNERAMEELAANLTTQGIVQPLVVRAIEDSKFEVVAGARRFRAAQLASLKEVPVVVRVLSDAAVRELRSDPTGLTISASLNETSSAGAAGAASVTAVALAPTRNARRLMFARSLFLDSGKREVGEADIRNILRHME